MYSQRDEETHILNHLPDEGTFLDIGAYHPTQFSNTRALVEMGWNGVYVEPAEDLMNNFRDEYKDNNGIQLIQKAVGTKNDKETFYDSQGDAIGTTVKSHADLWRKNYGVPYEETTVDMVTVSTLLELCKYKTFDFINIDIEGLDLQVFTQFDFNKTETKCVCVEFNGNQKQHYVNYANQFGFVLIHETAENLIFAR